MQRNYNPVIVFAFGKKECELLALQMSQLDLNDGKLIILYAILSKLYFQSFPLDAFRYNGLI